MVATSKAGSTSTPPRLSPLRGATFTVNNGRELLAFKREVFDLFRRVSSFCLAGAAEIGNTRELNTPTPALDEYLKAHPVLPVAKGAQ